MGYSLKATLHIGTITKAVLQLFNEKGIEILTSLDAADIRYLIRLHKDDITMEFNTYDAFNNEILSNDKFKLTMFVMYGTVTTGDISISLHSNFFSSDMHVDSESKLQADEVLQILTAHMAEHCGAQQKSPPVSDQEGVELFTYKSASAQGTNKKWYKKPENLMGIIFGITGVVIGIWQIILAR